jgi:PST family polysaccharide transporter
VSLFTIQPLKNELLVSIYTFILCFSVVFTQNWFFQAMQDLPKVAILNFIGKLLFTVFVLYFVKKPNDYVWQPLIASIVQIFVAILSFLWAIKKYELKLERVPIVDIIKVLWKEKMVFFSLVVISMYTTTNTVILGLIETPKQVGFYTAGQKLIDIAKNVVNIPISQALYPFIGSAFAISKEKGIQTVSKVIPLILIFTLIVAFLLLLGGSIFIVNFYGKDFEPSVIVFQILVFIPVIVSLNNIFGVQVMLNLKMDNIF